MNRATLSDLIYLEGKNLCLKLFLSEIIDFKRRKGNRIFLFKKNLYSSFGGRFIENCFYC